MDHPNRLVGSVGQHNDFAKDSTHQLEDSACEHTYAESTSHTTICQDLHFERDVSTRVKSDWFEKKCEEEEVWLTVTRKKMGPQLSMSSTSEDETPMYSVAVVETGPNVIQKRTCEKERSEKVKRTR